MRKLRLKDLDLNRPHRVTKFEQEGDVVTRKVYLVDEEGNETLYHESIHSAASLEETAKQLIKGYK